MTPPTTPEDGSLPLDPAAAAPAAPESGAGLGISATAGDRSHTPAFGEFSADDAAATFAEISAGSGTSGVTLPGGIEIVSGSVDETELAALMAVGMIQAAQIAASADAPPSGTSEWVRRARTGRSVAGRTSTPSTQWRWSCHP